MSYEMAILLVALLATSITISYAKDEKSILVRASLYDQSGSPIRFTEEMRKGKSAIHRKIQTAILASASKALAGSYELAGGFWVMKLGNDAEFIFSIKFPGKEKLNRLGCVPLQYFTEIGHKLTAASSEGEYPLGKSFEHRYNILYGVAGKGKPWGKERTMIIAGTVTDKEGEKIEKKEGIEEKVKSKLCEEIEGSFKDRLACKMIKPSFESGTLQAEIELSVTAVYDKIKYGHECMNKELIERVLKDLAEKQEGWEYKLVDIQSR